MERTGSAVTAKGSTGWRMKVPKTVPRVLIVDLSKRFGGTCMRSLRLLEALAQWRPGLACLEGSMLMELAVEKGYEVYPVAGKKTDPRVLRNIVVTIRREGFHVLDAQNVQSKFWSFLAAAVTGRALVSTLNSWYLKEHKARLRGRIYHLVERITSKYTDRYVAVSSEIGRRLIESGLPESRVAYVPNAVGRELASIAGDRHWLMRMTGVPRDAQVCCSVGRLVEAKGYDDLIKSFALLKERAPYCIIVGDGHLRPHLDKLIIENGLSGRVLLLGLQSPEDTLRFMRACDVFVLSSRSEGTPIVILEAGALAMPIVATNVGGIPDMVIDHEHALLVDPGDINAISNAVQMLTEKAELATRLGRNVQKRIFDVFSLEKQAIAMLDVYSAAVAEKRGRARG